MNGMGWEMTSGNHKQNEKKKSNCFPNIYHHEPRSNVVSLVSRKSYDTD